MAQHELEGYTLSGGWSYELAEPEPPAAPQERRQIKANTRYRGPRWDVELDTGWTEKQVHEEQRTLWYDELKERPATGHAHGDDDWRSRPTRLESRKSTTGG
jgi:hypothetical protein